MARLHATVVDPRAERLAAALKRAGVGTHTYAQLVALDTVVLDAPSAPRFALTPEWIEIVMRPAYADQVWRRLHRDGLTGYNTPSRRGSTAAITVEAAVVERAQTFNLRDVGVRVILRHRTSTKPTCATIDAAVLSVYGTSDPTEHPRVVLAGLADRLRRIATAIDAVVDQVEPPR